MGGCKLIKSKLLSIIVVIVLLFTMSLVGCGKSDSESLSNAKSKFTGGIDLKIGGSIKADDGAEVVIPKMEWAENIKVNVSFKKLSNASGEEKDEMKTVYVVCE